MSDDIMSRDVIAEDAPNEEVMAEFWTRIMRALTHQAKGEPLPEGLKDDVEEAVVCIAAATLVRAGMTIETAERKFCDSDYTIKLTYERESDEIGITVDWGDGTVTAASNGTGQP